MAVRKNVTVLRWRKGDSRRGNVFPPLDPDHFAYDAMCLLCAHKLGENVGGEGVQIVALYPPAAHRKVFDEGWYAQCYGLIVHAWCVAKRDDGELDVLAGVKVEEVEETV